MSGHRTARVLVYTHRWLGIASGVLFVSGSFPASS